MECYRFDLYSLSHALDCLSELIQDVVCLSTELKTGGVVGGKLQKVFDHIESLGTTVSESSHLWQMPDADGIRELCNKLQRGVKLVSRSAFNFKPQLFSCLSRLMVLDTSPTKKN